MQEGRVERKGVLTRGKREKEEKKSTLQHSTDMRTEQVNTVHLNYKKIKE